MSCSDKLARWALLGIQGALLGELLCAPLHLAGLAVCGATSESALRRALEGAHVIPAKAAGACAHQALVLSSSHFEVQVDFALRDAQLHMPSLNLNCGSPKPEPYRASGRVRELRARLPPELRRGRPPLRLWVVPLPDQTAACGLAPSPQRPIPACRSLNWTAEPSARLSVEAAPGGRGRGGGSVEFMAAAAAGGLMGGAPGRPGGGVGGGGARGFAEVTAAAGGFRAGASRRAAEAGAPGARSTLCKAALFARFRALCSTLCASAGACSCSTPSADGTDLVLGLRGSDAGLGASAAVESLSLRNALCAAADMGALPCEPVPFPGRLEPGPDLRQAGVQLCGHGDVPPCKSRPCACSQGLQYPADDLRELLSLNGPSSGGGCTCGPLSLSWQGSYGAAKRGTRHARAWAALLMPPSQFAGWTRKQPALEDFCLGSCCALCLFDFQLV